MAETALALREQPTTTAAVYDPRDINEARALSTEFAASRLFSAKRKEEALAVMGAGAELGLSPLASLRMIYVADFGNGPQIAISADAMVAACIKRRDVCEYFRTVESTADKCTVSTKRKGDPERSLTFTAEDAKRAKLGQVKEGKDATSSNWAKYPAVMLRHRAASILAREVYPDILGGMYTEDELREVARESRDVTPITATAEPVSPLRAVTAPEPVEAEIVESEADKVTRIEAALALVTTEDARKSLLSAEKLDGMPKGAARSRLVAAFKAAKERIAAAPAEPPHDADGVVVEERERQPGEEG